MQLLCSISTETILVKRVILIEASTPLTRRRLQIRTFVPHYCQRPRRRRWRRSTDSSFSLVDRCLLVAIRCVEAPGMALAMGDNDSTARPDALISWLHELSQVARAGCEFT